MRRARRGAAEQAAPTVQVESDAAPVQAMRLAYPFGFIETEYNRGRFEWAAGEVVRNPAEIALLSSHGAPLEPV